MKKILRKIGKVIVVIEDEIIDVIHLVISKVKKISKIIFSRKKFKHNLRNLVLILIALFFIGFGGGLLWFATIEIPDLASFDQRMLGQSTKIFDKTGKILLYDLSQNMRRTVVPFDQISINIKNATIAIEDKEFYQHNGIRISSLIRSAFANISSLEYSQGGSTITQQVVKNSLLTRNKTITRKIKEIFLAIKLERNLTKDQIFNLYLNETSYGGTIYGIEEASQAFFAKSSKDLSITESAYLAAIPQAPTYYSPYGNHREDLENRKNLVLSKMKEYGFINEEEYASFKNERVEFKKEVSGGIKAPHFVMFIRDYLEKEYGDTVFETGGMKVITTLDYEMQKKAEEILKRRTLENAKLYHATNAGMIVIDVKTGQILTMVGSRDYFDKEIDGNYNVTTAKRQPGSSFKPFIYAAAFNKGYRPETVLFDAQTQFGTSCSPNDFSDENGCYAPDNYDGKFRGPLSLRNALAQSINIPAVKLLYLVGINDALSLAKKMGISSLTTADQYGLSLVLGGGEVSVLEMTSAYSIFASGGIRRPSTGILKIETNAGKTLEEWEDKSEEVLPHQTALLVSDVLSDNVARTPVFGANSSLYFPDRQVAAKTGTTNNYRDTWVIGYTPQIAVGAWTGNNDNTPIAKQVAGYIVAPMWHEFMNELLKTLPPEQFEKPEPEDLTALKPIIRGDWKGDTDNQNVPSGIHSILYYVDKDNPMGPPPSNPYSDPQFERWEFGVKKWQRSQGIPDIVNQDPDSTIVASISAPLNFASYERGDGVDVRVVASGNHPITKIEYYLNSEVLKVALADMYEYNFRLDRNNSVSGSNILKVIVYDSSGAKRELYKEIEVR